MLRSSKLVELLLSKNLKLATAESCTGGMLACSITSISGASKVFNCGFVTYSNQSKTKLLKVGENIIKKHGAVSRQVALAMASGALNKSGADIAVGITGVAGPSGGSYKKPVGLVYIAVALNKTAYAKKFEFEGTRTQIRKQATKTALELVAAAVASHCVSQ